MGSIPGSGRSPGDHGYLGHQILFIQLFCVFLPPLINIFCFCCCCCYVTSVVSDSVRPHGLQPTGHLCPWDFPVKNTGVGCHSLLQGIFLIQGLNPRLLHLLHWQVDCLQLAPHNSSSNLQTYHPSPSLLPLMKEGRYRCSEPQSHVSSEIPQLVGAHSQGIKNPREEITQCCP